MEPLLSKLERIKIMNAMKQIVGLHSSSPTNHTKKFPGLGL